MYGIGDRHECADVVDPCSRPPPPQFILNTVRSLVGTLTFVVLFSVMRIVAYFNWFPKATPFLKRQSIVWIDWSFFFKVRGCVLVEVSGSRRGLYFRRCSHCHMVVCAPDAWHDDVEQSNSSQPHRHRGQVCGIQRRCRHVLRRAVIRVLHQAADGTVPLDTPSLAWPRSARSRCGFWSLVCFAGQGCGDLHPRCLGTVCSHRRRGVHCTATNGGLHQPEPGPGNRHRRGRTVLPRLCCSYVAGGSP